MNSANTQVGCAVLSADSLSDNCVKNLEGKELGDIKEIMIDTAHGKVAYAVLSFGGFMGFGDKLFALPWSSLQLDTENKCFVLDASKEQLEAAKGFDQDNWPNFADESFRQSTYDNFGQKAYWK